MKKMNRVPVLMGASLLLLLAACEQQGPAERAGEKIDEAAEKAGESLEKVKEGIEDAAEDAADKADKAMDNMSN